MSEEIQVNLDKLGQYSLKPLRNGKPIRVYIPDLLERNGADLTYVFNSPKVLQKVIQNVSAGHINTGMGYILQNMQRVRLCVFASESGEDLKDWQNSLQSIPPAHRLREIRFDIGNLVEIETEGVGKLMEQVKIQMQNKNVTISLVGCTDDQQKALMRYINQ